MVAPERDHRAVELRELGSPLDDRPEDRHALRQGGAARLAGVADLHAVVDERDAVHREDQRLGGQRRRLAEAGDRPLLVVVVGEAQVERAPREVPPLLLPGGADAGSRGAERQDAVERGVKGPGVVGVEGLRHEVGRAPLGEQEEIRADRLELRPGFLPEVGGDEAGHVAAEAVDAVVPQPVRHHRRSCTRGSSGSRSPASRRPTSRRSGAAPAPARPGRRAPGSPSSRCPRRCGSRPRRGSPSGLARGPRARAASGPRACRSPGSPRGSRGSSTGCRRCPSASRRRSGGWASARRRWRRGRARGRGGR